MENGIPLTTLWAFLIGAIASTLTILITVFTTSEYPPTEEEIKNKKSKKVGILSNTIKEIVDAFKEMPSTMKQLFSNVFPVVCNVLLLAISYFSFISIAF